MKNKIRVLLVDDHQIVLDGIANMMREAPDIELCCTATDVKKALKLIEEQKPDVVITDLSLPDKSGIELIRRISSRYPDIHVLVLSMYISEDYISNSIRAGAKGYLPKQDTTKEELLKAIRTVHKGHDYFNDQVAQVITRIYSHHAKSSASAETLDRQMNLTSRELEILRMYANGLSNQEIAEGLNISVRTVETHKNNIMQKYRFKSTVDMVKFAIRNKIVDL